MTSAGQATLQSLARMVEECKDNRTSKNGLTVLAFLFKSIQVECKRITGSGCAVTQLFDLIELDDHPFKLIVPL